MQIVFMKRPPSPPSTMPRMKRQRTTKKSRKAWVVRRGFESKVPLFSKSVFPYERWATLKYCEGYVTVNPAIGACAAYVLRANDLYDPNLTGTGHQPTGFDQYMAMYNRFVVYASKVKVIAMAPDSETADVLVGVAVTDSSTTYTQTEVYMEQALTDWGVLPGGAGGSNILSATSFNAAAFSGTSPKTNDLLHGNSAASPSKQWYYHIFAGATNSTDDPGTIKFSVEVEYRIKFFEPRTQTLS